MITLQCERWETVAVGDVSFDLKLRLPTGMEVLMDRTHFSEPDLITVSAIRDRDVARIEKTVIGWRDVHDSDRQPVTFNLAAFWQLMGQDLALLAAASRLVTEVWEGTPKNSNRPLPDGSTETAEQTVPNAAD